jgi:hypothetical protein
MFKQILKVVGCVTLLASPVSAQFGIGKKKKAVTFEEQQANAMAGDSNVAAFEDMYGNMGANELIQMIQESMNDPATLEYLEQMGAGMEEVMEQLKNMDPEVIASTIKENIAAMTSPETFQNILEQQDEVLQSLRAQGLITEEQMIEYQNDPAKFQEQMASAFEEMNKVLNDPESLNAAFSMMSGMMDMLGDPESAMKKLAETYSNELNDDAKIEEARLQLLANPEMAENPMLASLFGDEDMKDILNDPIKWRNQVKKGQEMLLGGGAGLGEF